MFNGQSIFGLGYCVIKGINRNPVNGSVYSANMFNDSYYNNYNTSSYSAPNNLNLINQNLYNNGYKSSYSSRYRTRFSSSKIVSASIPLFILGIIFLGVMGYFLYKGNNIKTYDLEANKASVVMLDDFFEYGENAYGVFINDDTYTIYYLDVSRANLNDLVDKEISGDITLKVGEEKDLESFNYYYVNTVKCAEIEELIIDSEPYFTFEQFSEDNKNNNTTLPLVLGVIGGVFILLGVISVVSYFKNKGKLKN